MFLPKDDRSYGTKEKMREQIVHLLGGRVAEKLMLEDISTGASNDILRATDTARAMVTKYGFSEKLGAVNYSPSDEVFLGNDYHSTKNYSEEKAREIDEEIKSIIDNAFAEAERVLVENKDKLILVAEVLMELETIDGEQFEQLYTGNKTKEEILLDVKEKEEVTKEKNEKEAEETQKAIEEEQKKLEEIVNTLNHAGFETNVKLQKKDDTDEENEGK